MDKDNFMKFLKEAKRTRPNPKSQIGHVQLFEKFLQKEKNGKQVGKPIAQVDNI